MLLVRKSTHAQVRNPIFHFPGKWWPAAGGGIAGTENVHFWLAHHQYLTTKSFWAKSNIPMDIYEQNYF
jgi:hypothetical protein